jgi:hypothetical protein
VGLKRVGIILGIRAESFNSLIEPDQPLGPAARSPLRIARTASAVTELDLGDRAQGSRRNLRYLVSEGHSLRRFAAQDIELVPKHKNFGFQRGARPEQPNQGAPDQPAKIAPSMELSTDSRGTVSCFWFAVGTGMVSE